MTGCGRSHWQRRSGHWMSPNFLFSQKSHLLSLFTLIKVKVKIKCLRDHTNKAPIIISVWQNSNWSSPNIGVKNLWLSSLCCVAFKLLNHRKLFSLSELPQSKGGNFNTNRSTKSISMCKGLGGIIWEKWAKSKVTVVKRDS